MVLSLPGSNRACAGWKLGCHRERRSEHLTEEGRINRLMFWAAAARKNCSRTNFILRKRSRRSPIWFLSSAHALQRLRVPICVGTVPSIASAIVELLAGRTEVAVAFGKIRKALGTIERTVLAESAVPRTHIRCDAPLHQPLQELSVAVGCISGH